MEETRRALEKLQSGSEEQALQERMKKTAEQKKKLFGNDNIKVGLAVSGGGPRAMCSTVGGLDGLAATGLLDCVDVMSVLSGSTWATARWLTNKGEKHAFHGTVDDPWKFGGKYDSSTHNHGSFSFGEEAQKGLFAWLAPKQAALFHRFKSKGVAALVLPTVRVNLMSEWAEFLKDDVVLKGIEHEKFCNIKGKLASGDYPIPICTAITRDKVDDSWQLVEFTPWQVRESRNPGKRFEDMEKLETKDLIAIWGSAFAVDSTHADGQKLLGMFASTPGRWLLVNEAVTDERKALAEHAFGRHFVNNVTHKNDEGYEFRDAGIDVNVPFAPLIRQGVDVMIVLDASGRARGPKELRLAVERGYVRVRDQDQDLLTGNFAPDEIVRVFWPASKQDPAIIYIMAATEESTFNFSYTNNMWAGYADLVKRLVVGAKLKILQVIKTVTNWKREPNRAIGFDAVNLNLMVHHMLEDFYRGLYQDMPLFGDKKKTNFESLFQSVELLKEDEGADKHLMPAGDCGLEKVWDDATASRIVLQGDGGTGKTIFTIKTARDQLWRDKFSGVVLVPLQNLAHMLLGNEDVTKDILLELIFEQQVKNLDEFDGEQKERIERLTLLGRELKEMVSRNSDSFVWVWDSFDEVEGNVQGGLKKLLQELVADKLSWAKFSVIASRRERKAIVENCRFIATKPWKQEHSRAYVQAFFKDNSDEALKGRAVKILCHDSELEVSPFLCEMVCESVEAKKELLAGCTVGQIFESAIEMHWDRLLSKRSFVTLVTKIDRAIAGAKETLKQWALECYTKGALANMEVNLALDDRRSACFPTDIALYRCGLLQQIGERLKDRRQCRFAHNMFKEYFAALALSEHKGAGNFKTLVGQVFTLKAENLSTERLVAKFLCDKLIGNHNAITDVTEVVTERMLDLIFGAATFESDMKAHGEDLSTRERWRKDLGVDLVVEFVTLLGTAATNLLMKKLRGKWDEHPNLIRLGNWLPKVVVRFFVPTHYRLFVEPAARCGNDALLERCLVNAKLESDVKLMKSAMLEAFLFSQQKCEQVLLSNKCESVSFELACKMGRDDAVEKYLMIKDKSDVYFVHDERLKSAFEICFENCSMNLVAATARERHLEDSLTNFSAESLVLESPKFFFWALRWSTLLVELKCSRFEFVTDGAKHLAAALKVNTTLTRLSFHKNIVGAEGAKQLAEVLKVNKSLTLLDLDLQSVGDEGAMQLAEALKVNTSLKILCLYYNMIGDEGAKYFSEALKVNTALTTLSLDNNILRDEGAKQFAEALKANKTLVALYLSRNNFRDVGELSDALKVNTTLTLLDLTSCHIGDRGANHLAEALKLNLSLKLLKLENCGIDKGAKQLGESLKLNMSLTSLNLDNNIIRDEGAKHLSEALKMNRTLTILYLSNNMVSEDGTRQLADALEVNTTLTTLVLNRNSMGDEGAKRIAEALKVNKTLTFLDLKSNNIGDDGSKYLAEALKVNTTLTNFYLSNNVIREKQLLAEALKVNMTLTTHDWS